MKHVLVLLGLVALATAPALADPIGDITAANAKLATVKSYRSTIVQPNGRTMQSETVNPDRTHMTEGPIEIISIGDTMYMKMGGAWRKEAPSGMSAGQPSLQKLYGSLPPTAVVRDLGMKAIDGAPLHAYFIQRSPDDQATTMYIGADGMPAQVEVTTQRGPMTMRFYDFNAPISIAAPI